jgi:hypothetical protein
MDTLFDFFDGLGRQGTTAILEAALMGLLAAAAALFARNWVRRGKVWVRGDDGHTCMSPLVLLVGLLCAAMAAACLVLGLLNPESLRERGDYIAWAGLVGAFSLAFLLILPYSRHVWDWNREGLRWSGAWRSVSIAWSDIERAGKTWDGQTFVADARGRKIYWSPYTLEHLALRDAIARQRPDLMLPAA